jgi:hypothetical protein
MVEADGSGGNVSDTRLIKLCQQAFIHFGVTMLMQRQPWAIWTFSLAGAFLHKTIRPEFSLNLSKNWTSSFLC